MRGKSSRPATSSTTASTGERATLNAHAANPRPNAATGSPTAATCDDHAPSPRKRDHSASTPHAQDPTTPTTTRAGTKEANPRGPRSRASTHDPSREPSHSGTRPTRTRVKRRPPSARGCGRRRAPNRPRSRGTDAGARAWTGAWTGAWRGEGARGGWRLSGGQGMSGERGKGDSGRCPGACGFTFGRLPGHRPYYLPVDMCSLLIPRVLCRPPIREPIPSRPHPEPVPVGASEPPFRRLVPGEGVVLE